jgi:hypothetical protein
MANASTSPRHAAAQEAIATTSAAASPYSVVTPEVDKAVARGLAFLANEQQADGSFKGMGRERSVAVPALTGLTFLASGSTPGQGPYSVNVSRCVDAVVSRSEPSGFITITEAGSYGPMYGHGFATLFLAEVYGASPRDDVRDALGRAVQLVVRVQNDEGGWRYRPEPRDADISVTVCIVMALRAASNAGIFVPPECIERSIAYIKRCQNADGGFRYMTQAGPSMFPRSAAALVGLYSAGIYEGPIIEHGLDYVMRHVPDADARRGDSHFLYGQYYAVQAMWHCGGERWQQWYPAIREQLLTTQGNDGSWTDAIGADYATAMATLVLQVPNDYLPIFQR